MLEVETTADSVRIFEAGKLIAVHALLHGRRQRSVLSGHRQARRTHTKVNTNSSSSVVNAPGHSVARRALDVYEAVAKRLAKPACEIDPAGAVQ